MMRETTDLITIDLVAYIKINRQHQYLATRACWDAGSWNVNKASDSSDHLKKVSKVYGN